eukprot:5768662-Amphidinium_carterae.1
MLVLQYNTSTPGVGQEFLLEPTKPTATTTFKSLCTIQCQAVHPFKGMNVQCSSKLQQDLLTLVLATYL